MDAQLLRAANKYRKSFEQAGVAGATGAARHRGASGIEEVSAATGKPILHGVVTAEGSAALRDEPARRKGDPGRHRLRWAVLAQERLQSGGGFAPMPPGDMQS